MYGTSYDPQRKTEPETKSPKAPFAEAAFGDLHYSFAQPLAHCRALCQPRIRSF